jgi:hypothetical protein
MSDQQRDAYTQSKLTRDLGYTGDTLINTRRALAGLPEYPGPPAHPIYDANTVAERFSFNVGTAIKYLWLSCESGNEIEDLEKAVWFVQREIERRKKELG